jgi:hypothetical protein
MKNRILTISSAILLMIPALASAQSSGAFNDVSASHKNNLAISWLKSNAVIAGYDDGSFKPEAAINRAELMKILVEGMGVTPNVNENKNCFPDVKEDWYAKYVCYAKTQGWVQGYPDGNFKPAQNVNDVEALKMILESQEISEPAGFSTVYYQGLPNTEWFYPYILTAEKLNIGGPYELGVAMNRGEVAEVIFRGLATKLVPTERFDAAAGTAMAEINLPRETVEAMGWIEGSLSYPSEQLPTDLQVCAKNTGTNNEICTAERITDSKYTYGFGYKLEVAPGIYQVYAVTQASGDPLKAYFTEFVSCGSTADCVDHTVIDVQVDGGETMEGVDPGDWYGEPVFE